MAPKGADEAERSFIQYDLGQLTMNLMLAATDLGIGSAHGWVNDQDLARELLGFPADRRLAWLLALGYPADRPLTPLTTVNRRPLDEIVHHGRW